MDNILLVEEFGSKKNPEEIEERKDDDLARQHQCHPSIDDVERRKDDDISKQEQCRPDIKDVENRKEIDLSKSHQLSSVSFY